MINFLFYWLSKLNSKNIKGAKEVVCVYVCVWKRPYCTYMFMKSVRNMKVCERHFWEVFLSRWLCGIKYTSVWACKLWTFYAVYYWTVPCISQQNFCLVWKLILIWIVYVRTTFPSNFFNMTTDIFPKRYSK